MKRQQKWLLTVTKTLAKPLNAGPIPLPWWRPTSSICRMFSGGNGVAVKKVTRSNFKSALDQLRLLVRESDFVSFDLEMSGVTSAPWRESFVFDDSDVQYLKIKDSAEKFAVVQFGICPFQWDRSKESFIANPHNFYIFHRKELPVDYSSYDFLCQTSSIDFLAKHQFDFNAYIHDGISYLSRDQEVEAKDILSSAFQIDNVDISAKQVEIPLISTSDILFSERMKNAFSDWRNGILDGSLENRIFNCSKPHLDTIFFKARPSILLHGLNSHQYKLIQRVIKKHFKDLVYIRTSNEENLLDKRIVVYSASEDDKTLLMKEVQEDLWSTIKKKISNAMGFRHIIDLLVSENKLLVGHSCILDIAHVYSKFFGHLPATMAEFASSFHYNFPHIIDTKHLLNGCDAVQRLMEKRSKSLSSVFSVLCDGNGIYNSSNSGLSTCHQSVKIEVPADETGSSWNNGAKHEAGYDAFMTGCVFVQGCSYMGIDFKHQQSALEMLENEKLQKHINFIYPNWKSEAVLNLKTGSVVSNAGDECNSDRKRSSWNNGAKHEAGYDAFMTGCVFVQGCSYMGIDFKHQQSALEMLENEKLQKHINFIYPNWKSEAVLNLKTGSVVSNAGDECNSDRKRYSKIDYHNIVLIWGFSPIITPAELKACITKGLGSTSVTCVFFIDKTAALVQFDNRELAAKFLLLKDTLERNNNVVSVVHPFSILLDGGNTRAADYDVYKEICSCPSSKILFEDQANTLGFRWMTKLMSDKVEVKKIVDSFDRVPSAADGCLGKGTSPTSVVKERENESSAEFSLNNILDSLFSTKILAERETSTSR